MKTKNMNNYFKSARDNLFLYIVFIAIMAFFFFISFELLKLAKPIKILGILLMIGTFYSMFRYPDIKKHLIINKNKTN